MVGRSGKIYEGLPALSTINNLAIIRNLFMAFKPERTLEIGFGYAGSGLVMAASHRDLGRKAAHQHTAIDPYQKTWCDDCGVIAFEKASLDGYLDLHYSFSWYALSDLAKQQRSFDFVYIDGSHLFEDVFVDSYFVNLLLKEQGMVLFDDSVNPHVKKVLRFIDRNFSSSYKRENFERFRLDLGNSLRYRFAKVLGKVQLTVYRKMGSAQGLRESQRLPFVDF